VTQRNGERAAAPVEDGSAAASLPDMVRMLDESQEPLLEGLREITADRLAEKAALQSHQ
jgi:hypothetical protein